MLNTHHSQTSDAAVAVLAAACGEDGAERRRTQRKPMFAAAILSGAGLVQPLACRIVDFSGFGARLRFSPDIARYQLGSIVEPRNARLLIVIDRLEADCEIVWRSGNEVGLRLKALLRPMTMAA